MLNNISLQAGGVYFKQEKVLLVKIDYGRNRGLWMIPGGMVESGETVEEAAIREVKEETGLETKIKRVIGLRSGLQEKNNMKQMSLYVVFEMEYVSGDLERDEHEIVDIKYWSIDEVKKSKEIVELSKEIILAAYSTKNGLYSGNDISTNNKYISYDYYVAQDKLETN